MKKTETSKIILCVLYFLMILIIGFTMYMTYKTSDITVLTPIIIGVFTLCSSATGFYYWKAKAENMEKIRSERAKSGNLKIDMSDIASIQDNTTAMMGAALGSAVINSEETYTEEETE